jgi:hypothetical protein
MHLNQNVTRRYLICESWFNEWMSFLYGQLDKSPSSIDNSLLVSKIRTDGFDSLLKNVDYFEFPLNIW